MKKGSASLKQSGGTDLSLHIDDMSIMNTHEHLHKEDKYVREGPDLLQELFDHYIQSDLISSGASPDAIKNLFDAKNPDVKGRFRGIQKNWENCQYTGYGEAVRIAAKLFYNIEEFTPENFEKAYDKTKALRKPGERLRILKEVGKMDHVQIDDFRWLCAPDESGPDFFLYDLSWNGFSQGKIWFPDMQKEVGIDVRNMGMLEEAMEAIFAKYAPFAIAVKSQHAYGRTLFWKERDKADAERIFEKTLKNETVSSEEMLCLGDWCLGRGVELSIKHNLPFKIHTGHHAGTGSMPIDDVRAGNLCALLKKYPQARFVLMHISYPYQDELLSLAKHYPNVYIDMCWAWSISPTASSDFIRNIIHTIPSNKLFGFGGDTFWPVMSVAFSIQARRWLTRALESEIRDGFLTERQAMELATQWLRGNQEGFFDLKGRRAAIAAKLSKSLRVSA